MGATELKYLCIKCRKIWGEGDEIIQENLSGGICSSCLIEYIRGKQKAAGYNDCFARGSDICSERCAYFQLCMKFLKEKPK